MLLLLLFIPFGVGCRQSSAGPDYVAEKVMSDVSAGVSAAHPLATEVGVAILRAGGNAVDAAVAVQFALAVVYPRAGNIGGGGFLLVRLADGRTDALDYRERAPLAATADMYLDDAGEPSDSLSRTGALAVGVPGTVAGMAAAHAKYGRLLWDDLVQPAVALAADGFRLSATEAERLNYYRSQFSSVNTRPNVFTTTTHWAAGDRLVQPALARTLAAIRDRGQLGFYTGWVADSLVAEMQRSGGIVTAADLEIYRAIWRTPISAAYRNYTLHSMPPPSSGGVALAQLLGMSARFPLERHTRTDARAIHFMAEAQRRAFADRATYLGDNDFYPVPVDSLLAADYLTARIASFDPARTSPSDSLVAGEVPLPESFETTHTSVVDAAGNAVSVTTTLNLNFGSKLLVGGAGFFLNDEMDDFSAKPGTPNFFGLVGAEANAIAPGKRMLSSMSPTIVEKDGALHLVLGAPGGSTIITAVYEVFMSVAAFGMPVEEAVRAGRFHHQWLPDQLLVEEGRFSEPTLDSLRAFGHRIETVERMAVMKAIQVQPDGSLVLVADERNPDDDVSGY